MSASHEISDRIEKFCSDFCLFKRSVITRGEKYQLFWSTFLKGTQGTTWLNDMGTIFGILPEWPARRNPNMQHRGGAVSQSAWYHMALCLPTKLLYEFNRIQKRRTAKSWISLPGLLLPFERTIHLSQPHTDVIHHARMPELWLGAR